MSEIVGGFIQDERVPSKYRAIILEMYAQDQGDGAYELISDALDSNNHDMCFTAISCVPCLSKDLRKLLKIQLAKLLKSKNKDIARATKSLFDQKIV